MTSTLVSQLLCHIFKEEAGTDQLRAPEQERRALLVSTNTKIDYDKEEGYRYADMVLYAGYNYVQVWVRTRWNVAPLPPEDVEWEDHDWQYDEGSSPWERWSFHDSCWRSDGVDKFLRSFEHLGFNGLSFRAPYDVIDLVKVKELGIELSDN
jgi:hypothetical protein